MCLQVVEAKIQEITLFEWLPALNISPEEVFVWQPRTRALRQSSEVSTEFLILYRWGHGSVPNAIGGFEFAELFNGENFYGISSSNGTADPEAANAKLDNLITASATEAQSEIDGQMADSLRRFLFNIGLDLAVFNIFRARDVGLPSYPRLARCYGLHPNPKVSSLCSLPTTCHSEFTSTNQSQLPAYSAATYLNT
jgi:hypothetical protein